MLINIRISELQSNTSNSIPLSIIILITFNSAVYSVLPYDILLNTLIKKNGVYTSYILSSGYMKSASSLTIIASNGNDLSYVTSKTWDGNLAEFSDIGAIGSVMYTNYSI